MPTLDQLFRKITLTRQPSFTQSSVLDILNAAFVGTTVRRITYAQPIWQERAVWVKKSANVTDKQFTSGEPRYRYLATRRTRLGTHTKYADELITAIQLQTCDEDDSTLIIAILESGYNYVLPIADLITSNNH